MVAGVFQNEGDELPLSYFPACVPKCVEFALEPLYPSEQLRRLKTARNPPTPFDPNFLQNLFRACVEFVAAVAAPASFARASVATTLVAPEKKSGPIVLLVPVKFSDKALENGCRAQFYDERPICWSVFLT